MKKKVKRVLSVYAFHENFITPWNSRHEIKLNKKKSTETAMTVHCFIKINDYSFNRFRSRLTRIASESEKNFIFKRPHDMLVSKFIRVCLVLLLLQTIKYKNTHNRLIVSSELNVLFPENKTRKMKTMSSHERQIKPEKRKEKKNARRRTNLLRLIDIELC